MDEPGIPDGVGEELEEFGGLEGVRKLSPDPSTLKRMERIYSLLSAGRRIEILYFLNFSDMTPSMLAYLTGMAPNLLSFHLSKLESSGIVTSRRMGRFVVYSVTDMGRKLSGPLG